MRNKKGFITSGLVSVWLYISTVILIILFYFVMRLSVGDNEVKISGKILQSDAGYQLVNYLRMPHIVEGRSINTAELIAMYANEKDKTKKKFYRDELTKTTKEIFDPLEHCTTRIGVKRKFLVSYGLYIVDKAFYDDPERQDYRDRTLVKDNEFGSKHFTRRSTTFDPDDWEQEFYAIIPGLEGNEEVRIAFLINYRLTYPDLTGIKNC